MFGDFGWGAEFSPFHSQDLSDELSQDSDTRFKFTSSLSSDNELDSYFTANNSTQSSLFSISSSPVEIDKSDDELEISSSPIENDKSDGEEEEKEEAEKEEAEKEKDDGWKTVGSNRKKWGMYDVQTGVTELSV